MNPFPQIADARYDAGERILRELAAEPIPDVEYIRQKLAGFSQEFIDLCCQNYRKGETVKFDVTFPDDL